MVGRMGDAHGARGLRRVVTGGATASFCCSECCRGAVEPSERGGWAEQKRWRKGNYTADAIRVSSNEFKYHPAEARKAGRKGRDTQCQRMRHLAGTHPHFGDGKQLLQRESGARGEGKVGGNSGRDALIRRQAPRKGGTCVCVSNTCWGVSG